jgi:hypothetical protein
VTRVDEDDYFDAPIAVNPNATTIADLFVPNAVFEVFAVDDVARAEPLAVYEATSGAAIPELRSSVLAQLPQFRVEGDPQEVILKSGTFETRVKSTRGMQGLPGKSAYQTAVEFGYEGTEAEFGAGMAQAAASTVVGGHIDEEGRLVLDTSGGGVIITQRVVGTDGTDGEDGADGTVVEIQEGAGVTVDSTDPSRPIIIADLEDVMAGTGVTIDKTNPKKPVIAASGGGGTGNGHVYVVQWNGTSWVSPTPPAGAGTKIRIFDPMGATGVPAYTGPTIAGVTDYYAATFAG